MAEEEKVRDLGLKGGGIGMRGTYPIRVNITTGGNRTIEPSLANPIRKKLTRPEKKKNQDLKTLHGQL